MPKDHFLRYAVLFEGGLAVGALVLGKLFGLRLEEQLRFDGEAWCFGLLATLPLLAAYFALKPISWNGLRDVDRIVRQFFRRYMADLSLGSFVLIALLAGLGEELLFRGLFQKGFQSLLVRWGADGSDLFLTFTVIFAVSVLFGLGHAITKTYFFLAFLISIYLGVLFRLFDNLAIPILVHALYDFFVFFCLKYENRSRV